MATTRRVLQSGYWKARSRADIPEIPHLELPTTPTPWLAFDLLTRAAIVAQQKKLWSHAFVTFPYGGDGRANLGAAHYQKNMPGGTLNTAYGGELRDRPIEIAGVTRPRTEPSWWVLDRAEEVRIARESGMHGFTVDWLNLNDGTGDNRTGQVREYCEAIRYLGVQDDFKMILMPDGSASICDAANFTALLNKTADLLTTYPDVFYRDVDGLWVIAPYYPEGAPSSNPTGSQRVLNTNVSATHDYWTNYIAGMAARGFTVKLAGCYVRSWTTDPTTSAALHDVFWMEARWGDADYLASGSSSVNNGGAAAYAHAHGCQWMHPVRAQDNRHYRGSSADFPKFWEAGNMQNLINGYVIAITTGADWLQNPTWSDFREHAHTIPSINHGHCWLDLSAYFFQRFMTGFWPVIVRDNLFLSHRIHRSSGYTITGTQTAANVARLTGGSPVLDKVEIVAQIVDVAHSSFEIVINGVAHSFAPSEDNIIAAGATGVYRETFDLPVSGTVAGRIRRNGVVVAEVESPHTISNTVVAHDPHYRVVGSLRGVE